MHIESGKIIYGKANCLLCNEGTVPEKVKCKVCNGTGKGKRGGAGGCKECHGLKYNYDQDHRIPCKVCGGVYFNTRDEDRYCWLPNKIFQSLNFKVYRLERGISGNESILGLDCLWSCEDYGEAYRNNDADALIEKIKNHGSVQVCNVVDQDDNICDHVAILVNRGGYSLRAVFGDVKEVIEKANREKSYHEYLVGNSTFDI